jgi:uncharacterized protein (DUF427 family)
MADNIRLRKAIGTWVIRAGGAVIGESRNAVELTEGDYPAVIYFPRNDIATVFLEPSQTHSHCRHKGDADYFSIVAASGTIHDAAWSYASPPESLSQIAGHLAFYTDKVAVERV